MGNYEFLPLAKTAKLIQEFTERTWPLPKEDFEEIFTQCGLSLQLRDPHTRFQTFTINRKTYAGSIATRSFGIPRVSFHPCDYPQNMGNAEATPLANEYMLSLIDLLKETLGEPRFYHDNAESAYFVWWQTEDGGTVKIEYGSSLPTITIVGSSQSEDPADVLALPSTERCVQLIRTWVEADLPISVPDVHLTAEELGWIAEELSSQSFYSELPSIVYGCQPPCMVGEDNIDPDVTVSYKGNSAGQIDFSLADYLSIRSEADAFPAILERMKEVESALIAMYGEPARSSSFGVPFVRKWELDYGVTLTLSYGQGKSDVRIRHERTMTSTPSSYPSVYKVTHALEALVNWADVMPTMGIDEAASFAKDIGWFPVDESDPREFYTPISAPAQATANIAVKNNQVEFIHFTIAHQLVKGAYEPHPDIALAALDIETALSDEYGKPIVLHHNDVDYRDWETTPSGARIRLASNTTKAEAWIYRPDQCEQIDVMTAPMLTPVQTSVAPGNEDTPSGLNTLQKIGFVLLGVALAGYAITLVF